MSEHGEPGPEDQEDEASTAEKLRNYELIIGTGDVGQIEGKIEFYDGLIDGMEGLQLPLEEQNLPPEVQDAVRDQRRAWQECLEATRRNASIIKAAIEGSSG